MTAWMLSTFRRLMHPHVNEVRISREMASFRAAFLAAMRAATGADGQRVHESMNPQLTFPFKSSFVQSLWTFAGNGQAEPFPLAATRARGGGSPARPKPVSLL